MGRYASGLIWRQDSEGCPICALRRAMDIFPGPPASASPDVARSRRYRRAARLGLASYQGRYWRDRIDPLSDGATPVGEDRRTVRLWKDDGGHRVCPSSAPVFGACLHISDPARPVARHAEGRPRHSWRAAGSLRRGLHRLRATAGAAEEPRKPCADDPDWTCRRIHGTQARREIRRAIGGGLLRVIQHAERRKVSYVRSLRAGVANMTSGCAGPTRLPGRTLQSSAKAV